MAFDTSATPVRVQADGSFMGKTYWTFTGTDSDASTAIDVVAAPSGGRSHYITGVILGVADVDAFPQLQDGAATLLFGPFSLPSASPYTINWKFDQPIKVTADKSIAVKCAAAGSVYVYIEGFTAG